MIASNLFFDYFDHNYLCKIYLPSKHSIWWAWSVF